MARGIERQRDHTSGSDQECYSFTNSYCNQLKLSMTFEREDINFENAAGFKIMRASAKN